ncbi:MAG: hypothetical protein IPK75_00560 [Acidobacteria bacterium]|jgi:hypothetical protein|nr:hypothetical protein [Acidobacteriota bacterium]
MAEDLDKKFASLSGYEKNTLFMFSELGLAITAWSTVDLHLNEMFAMIVAAEHFHSCVSSFENIVSFRTKIEATINASEDRFGKTSAHHYVVNQLLQTALKQSKHRNSIAHSFMSADRDGFGILPVGKIDMKDDKFLNKYTEAKIKRCAENFAALSDAMNAFNHQIEADNGWTLSQESRRPLPPLLNHIYPHTGRSFSKQRPPLLPSPE